jgi:chromosome segregation ATPase
MKRILSLTTVLLALQLPVFAQSASTAAAVADRQDAEERYKRMSADVEALQAANASLQKKINALEERLSKVGDDVVKASNNKDSSVHDDLKLLKEKIQEVDKKRESDKQIISDEIKKSIAEVEKLILKAPASHSSTAIKDSTHVTEAPPTSDKGFSYTIQDGDTLSAIVVAYNKKFQSEGMKKINMKKVQDANPTVNWNRLHVGQKIVIPSPEG